jgi:hypothetical protein
VRKCVRESVDVVCGQCFDDQVVAKFAQSCTVVVVPLKGTRATNLLLGKGPRAGTLEKRKTCTKPEGMASWVGLVPSAPLVPLVATFYSYRYSLRYVACTRTCGGPHHHQPTFAEDSSAKFRRSRWQRARVFYGPFERNFPR